MPSDDFIPQLLRATTFAVVGASRQREKYGFRVYRALKAAGKTVWPVNPSADTVDDDPCWPTLASLPAVPDVAVMIVPPAVTETAVAECVALGIDSVWMQPGAESEAAIAAAQDAGMTVVAGSPCMLIELKTEN